MKDFDDYCEPPPSGFGLDGKYIRKDLKPIPDDLPKDSLTSHLALLISLHPSLNLEFDILYKANFEAKINLLSDINEKLGIKCESLIRRYSK